MSSLAGAFNASSAKCRTAPRCAPKSNFPSCHKQIAPSGKSVELRQSLSAKIFRFSFPKNRTITMATSSPRRDVGHRHQALGWDCGGRSCSADDWTRAYGEVVWSWRRYAGVKFAGSLRLLTDDGDNKALSPGRSRISRKAIAQGMSVCSPLTCMLVCAFLHAQMHTRPRVQRAPGIPCALYFGRGATKLDSSGKSCREIE